MQSLVASGIFKVARVLFLVSGHTHWVQDQRFSRIAVKYYGTFKNKSEEVMTPDDLCSFIKSAVSGVKDKVKVEVVHRVRDWDMVMRELKVHREFKGGIAGPEGNHVFHFESLQLPESGSLGTCH